MTRALILACVVGFFISGFVQWSAISAFALWPLNSGQFMPWQLLTYGLLHGSLTHLAVNMFGLWMFGSDLERVWGQRRFIEFFVASVVVAGVVQLIVSAVTGTYAPTVGASGGLFGLLMGFALVFPKRIIVPLIPPIPMPAPVFVAIYGLLELFLGITGTQNGVAHFAHLGGLLGGWLVYRFWWRRR